MTYQLPAEARARRLLRMMAGLEEAIIRLEGDGGREDLVARLRGIQEEIRAALRKLADDPTDSELSV